MKYPKTIKLGSRHYSVSIVSRLTDTDGITRMLGCVDHNALKIQIEHNRHRDAARETLMHEVLHACGSFAGFTDEEEWVARLAPVLSMLLADNPDFLKLWIGKKK